MMMLFAALVPALLALVSNPVTAEESIRSRLIPTPSFDVTLEQGRTEKGFVSIGADEALPDDLTTFVEIVSEPSRGLLIPLDVNDQGTVKIGTRLELDPGQSRTSIRYKSDSDEYFTRPDVTASGELLHLVPDSFEYRLVAVDSATSNVLATSAPATQYLHIRNVNRAPTLTAPKEVQQTEGGLRVSRTTYIEGIRMEDPDLNVNKVRVDLLAINGTVSLNERDRWLADFCSHDFGKTWQCQGDYRYGIKQQRKMTFLAEPDQVGLILSRLEFKSSSTRGANGQVTVRAYDGVGGDCLGASEFFSVSDKCFRVEATIELPASQESGENEFLEEKIWGIPRKHFIRGAVYLVLVIIIGSVVMCFWQFCCGWCCGWSGVCREYRVRYGEE